MGGPDVKNMIKWGEKEFDRIYGAVRRGEVEVQRELPKGEPIKARQVRVIIAPRRIGVVSHTRAGRSVKAYHKSYKKWSTAEVRFLKVRKIKKLPSKRIAFEYSKHFAKAPRPSSSISTKLFRLS